jgi:glycosyltransferase involved in cell wall biosynthesis
MGQSKLFMVTSGFSIIDVYDIYTTYTKSKLKVLKLYSPFYWLFFIEALRVKNFEKQLLRSFDMILVTCFENYLKVNSFNLLNSLHEISNGTNYPEEIHIKKGKHLLMVGNFEYSGNLNGIQWFLKAVWPLLKAKININLVLVGKHSEKLKKLIKGDSQVELTGIVPKLDKYYENACCVILPLFNDGGTKTKLIEAMAFGVPIVSTSIGAKGFESTNTISISDHPKEFFELIENIFTDNYPINSLIKSRKMIKNNYTWDGIGNQLNNLISTINANT